LQPNRQSYAATWRIQTKSLMDLPQRFRILPNSFGPCHYYYRGDVSDECDCYTDRYVLVGGHYDSATYGAVGANSGTAVLMELAKAFSRLADTGQSGR